MSENKFIARLKGEPTPKSVVEIQNDRLVAPFKSSPMGHIADRDSSVVVAKGAQNWAVNQGQLVPVADDYIGTESDLSGISRVSGAGLWLNATYTFPASGDETNPVSAIIAPSAKWVLTLCGDSLITQNGSVITLTMLVKIGATHLTTKQFKIRECASQFSQRLAIDFSESEQKVIKAHGGSPLTVQVLCDDEGASATIYSGMTHLTLLQRKIDADLVATDNILLPEFIENLLEGYIIPADYFSRYDYIEQVEDGATAMPEFTRNGDNMSFSGWAKPAEEVYTKTEIDNKFIVAAAEIATKQDKLIAGDNIIISGNVISATGAGGGAGFDVIVVQELPATGQKGIIYLLAKDSKAPDIYDEYIWVTSTQTFEFIGTTQVDLSDYATKEDLNTVLPDQAGNTGKFLTTDGSTASWSDKPLVNTAKGVVSICVGGTGELTTGMFATAVGKNSYCNGGFGVAIGYNAKASADRAIQVGGGTNSDANTFKVSNANGNFTMMSVDGTIPADRMSATAGTTGQVLTKTDAGMEWQEASGGTTITLKEYDE